MRYRYVFTHFHHLIIVIIIILNIHLNQWHAFTNYVLVEIIFLQIPVENPSRISKSTKVRVVSSYLFMYLVFAACGADL